ISVRVGNGIGEIEHRIRVRRADINQACVWIESRRWPIRGATRARRNQRAGDLRSFFKIANRLAFGIDAFVPVGGLQIRRGQKTLTVGPIENEEESIAADLREQLALPAVHDTIEENRNLRGIPIMR